VLDALTLCGTMFEAYLKTVRHPEREVGVDSSFEKVVDENEKFLIRGTSFKEEPASTD
jgi:hypothetical protein